MVREGRVLISSVGDPDFGSSYYVTAYEVGAQVTSGSSGTTITVRAGHGFAALDKFIVLSEFPATTKYRTVTVAGATTLTVGAVVVSAGDILVNLGQDTGVATPNYVDGRGAGFPTAVYSDMDYQNFLTNSTLQTDSNGRYTYYHQGIAIWELVRSSTTVPFAVYQSGAQSVLLGPGTAVTDNAIARWDTTSGQLLQNSVVTIGDTGATTGITTLGISGAGTFGSSLAITGALTGVTTLAASGLITGSAGATITGGTTSLAATTVSTTLAVTGATTLTGGVTGAMVATGNVTSGGHILGAKATVAITSNTAFVMTSRILLDITNTSGNNTACTLTAPSSGDGQIVVLRIAAVSGGSLSIINSTTALLVGAIWTTPGQGDTLTVISSGTLWYEIARSNN